MKNLRLVVCLSLFCVSFSFSQTFSKYILVDQFGYLPTSNKVAVIRNPNNGYDAADAFTPSTTLLVKNATNDQTVYSGNIQSWKSGTLDPVSGDYVWWFDFSSVTTIGTYYILDVAKNEKSANFQISAVVYRDVLKASMRYFFYQRAGFAKTATFAGVGWADGASHLGNLQDKNCRLYNDKNNISKERDLSGGWYDAGDYNKYTPWTASYVATLLLSYKENPLIWADNYNIPESGNGIPDILDEVKWGMDWLLKMQQTDGSCLSVVGLANGTPPSSATGQSVYGPATTNATFRSAAAFALGAKYLKQANPTAYGAYATLLQTAAVKAWNWGVANPNVQFDNSANGVAAGNQETDNMGRLTAKMSAALYLYELTGTTSYLTFFESKINELPLIAYTNYVSQYFQESQDILLYYLDMPGINATKANQIKNATLTAANSSGDFVGALNNQSDPYRAFIKDYNWGSNSYKSLYGSYFMQLKKYNLDPGNNSFYQNSAEEYLHYIHGVNPFSLVYLSNMATYGSENSVREVYHSWFDDGSAKWDKVGVSTYGPAPGFLVGGPNSSYSVDSCCPSGCGNSTANALCATITGNTLPLGQPAMKSYKDFNTSWPLNSWQITENSNGYQVNYIRLLSKFVNLTEPSLSVASNTTQKLSLTPNPTKQLLTINLPFTLSQAIEVAIYNVTGAKVWSGNVQNGVGFSVANIVTGVYVIKANCENNVFTEKFIKE